jgi:small-conductance mechanosensitive channel
VNVDFDALPQALQPLLAYLGDHPYARAGALLLVGLLLAWLTAMLSAALLRSITRRTRGHTDDLIVAALRGPLFWTVTLLAVLGAVQQLQLSETIEGATHSAIVTLLIFIWSFFALRLARILLNAFSSHARLTSVVRPQTLPLFNNLAVVLVMGAAIYLVFNAWNIDMTAWLASAGILGIAVGFAAKDTLANLFSGVFILADAPYKIGDYVLLDNGERGKITHIGIRSTRLLTRDDVEVTIPNAIMGNTRITNESGGPHEKFRIRVKVGVAYGSDIDLVRQVLQEVAEQDAGVCDDPEPRVRFRAFGPSSLDLELLCWVENPELRGRVVDSLNTAIYKGFNAHGIQIPFAQQDVYIKELPAGLRPIDPGA